MSARCKIHGAAPDPECIVHRESARGGDTGAVDGGVTSRDKILTRRLYPPITADSVVYRAQCRVQHNVHDTLATGTRDGVCVRSDTDATGVTRRNLSFSFSRHGSRVQPHNYDAKNGIATRRGGVTLSRYTNESRRRRSDCTTTTVCCSTVIHTHPKGVQVIVPLYNGTRTPHPGGGGS